MGYFEDNSLSIRLLTSPNNGFRPGQLGALHAVMSHFSVYEEPALLSLPTGYGKTAVMMALPFILKSRRLLIVEPSDALRKQTTGHFRVLSILHKISVVDDMFPNPKVLGQKGRPTSEAQWDNMRKVDIVVSTPNSTSPSLAPNPPIDLFDLIILDEAHHAPAQTWNAYLEHFSEARFVFLTATPFRRDRLPIPGRLAYCYPVTKASREKAFGKVRFMAAPVVNDQDESEIEQSVAQLAFEQLSRDRTAGFDHRIFARTGSIKSAKALVKVYADIGANIEAIASHVSRRYQDVIEKRLIDGELDGVVCVDMFGEGYDFPKLKIAALHEPHRSLVPTLQFIGRFARTNDVSTGDATLIAPISKLKDAIFKLFQEGVDVAELIDDVAQAQVAEAEADREILQILKVKKQALSDYDAVSPLLLKLYAHAQIFHCSEKPDFSAVQPIVGRNLQLVKQWISEDGLITLLLTIDHSPPDWAASDALANSRHDAFLLAFNDATRLCFIGSTRRTKRIYLELMETVCPEKHRPLSYEVTRRALAGLTGLRFYNLGFKNTAINTQAESYRMLTGPHAERAVTAGDGRAYVQGHFFGSGVSNQERETIGASSSSRIWSNKRLTVAEYLDWITILNNRLNGDDEIAASQLDIVQHARLLQKIPERIIAAGWNKVAYRSAPRVRYRRENEDGWHYSQVTDLEFANFNTSDDKQFLRFEIGNDSFATKFIFTLTGGVLVKQDSQDWTIEILSGLDDWMPIGTWMAMHPPIFYAADKSSFEGMNLMRPPKITAATLAPDDTTILDWDGCAIQVECDEARANGQMTVHQYLEHHLQNLAGLQALIYDHRSGEAADFIAITKCEDEIFRVSLYHCKGAGGSPSGGRFDDVCEVAGQVLKSVAYCEASVLCNHVEHRINEHRHSCPSRFIVGDFPILQRILKDTPANKLFFDVYAVQPGIAQSQIDEHLADLMLYGLEYVRRGGAANAAWIINS